MPTIAVLASGSGMVAAMVLSKYFQDSLFVFMIGLSSFGALFTWSMTMLTHLAFRRHHQEHAKPYVRIGPAGPWTSLFGLVAVLAVMLSTWWVPAFHVTLLAGIPWLALLTVCYFVWRRNYPRTSDRGE